MKGNRMTTKPVKMMWMNNVNRRAEAAAHVRVESMQYIHVFKCNRNPTGPPLNIEIGSFNMACPKNCFSPETFIACLILPEVFLGRKTVVSGGNCGCSTGSMSLFTPITCFALWNFLDSSRFSHILHVCAVFKCDDAGRLPPVEMHVAAIERHGDSTPIRIKPVGCDDQGERALDCVGSISETSRFGGRSECPSSSISLSLSYRKETRK